MDPKTLRFADSHEWVALEGDIATVGVSQFAVDQLSDLLLIELPPVGKVLEAGQAFGQIESVKNVSDLYAPVAGEVVAVNDAVIKDVQVLGQGPYNQGWLIKLKVSDPASVDALMDSDAYDAKVAAEDH